MKVKTYLMLITVVCSLAVSGLAQASRTCQEKQQKIQQQLDYAQAHNNQYRILGLQTALTEVQQNCRDGKLQRQHQRKIAEKQAKVVQRQRELKAAEQYGEPKNIAKQQKKLHKAEQQLREVQQGDD